MRSFEIWIEILDINLFFSFFFNGWKFQSRFEFLFEIQDTFFPSESRILKSPIKFLGSKFGVEENILKLG